MSSIMCDSLSSSVKVVSRAGLAEAKRRGWPLAVQHTAPVRAKPDGRPRLEEAHYRYPTSYSLPVYTTGTLHITHALAHTYKFPFSFWANALDHYEISVLRSRAGWISARNNERASMSVVQFTTLGNAI